MMKRSGGIVAVPATCLRYGVENLHAAEGCCGKKSKARTDSFYLSHMRGVPRKATRIPGKPARAAQVGGDALSSDPGRERLSAERGRTWRSLAFSEEEIRKFSICCRICILPVLFSIQKIATGVWRAVEGSCHRGSVAGVNRPRFS
jgi:hypothetical protein